MTERINQQQLLMARPEGNFKHSDFKYVEEPVRPLEDGEFLVESVYLSLDPTMRGWASFDTYLPAVPLGTVMRGSTVGTVVESNHPNYAVGDAVLGMSGWQKYFISNGRGINKLPPLPPGVPMHAHFGLFGHIGMTAYFGLVDICEPKEGETLVVSAAAGAVGSLVGQIGKVKGCRVVGIAGTDEKCAWLTDDLGFDAAINYKTQNVYKALREACPDGIDIYFENVGGTITDAVVPQLNNFARISLCGLISQYNAETIPPGPNWGLLLTKRVKLQGFIVLDYMDRAMEAFGALGQWYASGQVTYKVHEVVGLENAVDAINLLFTGGNTGKLVLKIE